MENEIIPVIKADDRNSRMNAGNHPDEKEKDDSGVKLPERDLVMKRPPAGQAPDPSESQRGDLDTPEMDQH